MSQLTVQQALQILQLQPGATKDDIRKAYKHLALKLHPDKQQQAKRQPLRHAAASGPFTAQHATTTTTTTSSSSSNSSSTPTDAAASFSLLSAAYSLLTSTRHHHTDNSHTNNSSSGAIPSFAAAYACGSLFCDALVDEAVLAGLAPADVAQLQQLTEAAAAGQLAAQLAADPPAPEAEQQWQQLYKRLTVRWQLQQLQQNQQRQQQQQQQQQAAAAAAAEGVGIGGLLSDLLLKPTGQIMVELSEEEQEDEWCSQEAVAEQHLAAAAAAGALQKQVASQCERQHTSLQLQQRRCKQQLAQPIADEVHSSCQRNDISTSSNSERAAVLASSQEQQPQQQQQRQAPAMASIGKRRQRHGWGFYWLWLRRLLLAKAVLSFISSSSSRKFDIDGNLFTVL